MTPLPGSHDGDVGLPDYIGGWMAHGHSGYRGYAWYRRAVTVPAERASWDISGPTLAENGYEPYWNGQLWAGPAGSAPRVDHSLGPRSRAQHEADARWRADARREGRRKDLPDRRPGAMTHCGSIATV